MQDDTTPAALIDIDDAATALGLPPDLARGYLASRYDYPVARYRGRDLWLSDTVHDAIAELQAVAEVAP